MPISDSPKRRGFSRSATRPTRTGRPYVGHLTMKYLTEHVGPPSDRYRPALPRLSRPHESSQHLYPKNTEEAVIPRPLEQTVPSPESYGNDHQCLLERSADVRDGCDRSGRRLAGAS